MKLTFHGGAKMVTGANYLLEADNSIGGVTKILIDCGLRQGSGFAEHQNFEPFPYNPKDIEAVFVTHAHIDHTGLLPKLYKDGFRGKIYSTTATKGFAEALLLDSEHILSLEAERSRKPLLYQEEDVFETMKLWKGIGYHEPVDIGAFRVELYDAGHILGSAFIKVESGGKSIVFSGDLGNYPAPIIKETEKLPEVDYCLIESTYGDRVHEDVGRRREMLEDTIEDTVRVGGVLIIPAFAMERTQQLLFELNELVEHGRIPRVPIYIDSPLAIKLTKIYKNFTSYFNKETSGIVKSGDDILQFPGLHMTLTTQESKSIAEVKPPKVVIAGSGMSQGGRILYHEKKYLSDPKNTILFIGFQAKGSMGREILDGAKTVKILHEDVPVKARAVMISGYSAHADQPRLVNWLKSARMGLKKVFVVQGEENSADILAAKISDELAIHTEIPNKGESVEL
ncbi:MAG: MBL fold metallo-hydrolase [bacterium]|nr:MBL fold metallo-hydrolase [bacterium]